ncbi:hypothetical protein [Vibrio owensii]
MKFSPQYMLNLIAKTAYESKCDKEGISKIHELAAAYRASKDFDSSTLPLINVLDGIELDSGKIFDEDLLIETAENQIEDVQSRDVTCLLSLFKNEKEGKGLATDSPIWSEVLDSHLSIGYHLVETEITIKGDNELLSTIERWLKDDREIEAFVDVRTDESSVIVFACNHVVQNVFENIESAEDMHDKKVTIDKTSVAPYVVGFRDLSDYDRRTLIKEELQKSGNFSNERNY